MFSDFVNLYRYCNDLERLFILLFVILLSDKCQLFFLYCTDLTTFANFSTLLPNAQKRLLMDNGTND